MTRCLSCGALNAPDPCRLCGVAGRVLDVPERMERLRAELPADAILGLKDSLADTDYTTLPPAKQIYNVAAGELLPTILKDRNRIQRDLESALDELRAIKESAPGGGSGGTGTGGARPEVVGDSFTDRLKARLAGAA